MPDIRVCFCGSGLRQLRCCAVDLDALSPPSAAAGLAPLLKRAESLLQSGDPVAAEGLAGQVLELAPGYLAGLLFMYRLFRQQNRIVPAEALIGRVVAINPNHYFAVVELTLLLLGRGALAAAELHARNAVRIAPESAQSHSLMGMVMTEANRPLTGEHHYRRTLALAPADPITLANLAWNLKTQGRLSEARAMFQEALSVGPHVLQTYLGAAKLEEADRCFAAALALLERAEQFFPTAPGIRLTRATVLARQNQNEAALRLLDALEQEGQARLGPVEMSEKGRLLDQLGRYDEAFAAFDQAKRDALAMGAADYQSEAATDLALRLKNFFVRKRLAILPRAARREDVPQPIFITGFPRSGTTLIEQSLSLHSRVAAGDELPLINDIAQIMPRRLGSPLGYPEALAELWMGDQQGGLDELRDHYLNGAASAGAGRDGAAFFTDKMPLNETHLGLMALLFPAVPVIHVIRHPLDVVLSVYANHLTHGMHCAARLESIAQHYVLIADLVSHYRDHLKLRYLAVRYEDVVDNQEASIRAILTFAGLRFEPACLQFETNPRLARTASYAQVTETLYRRSRFRYRRYLQHLGPVLEILAPVIAQLGYTVDWPDHAASRIKAPNAG